MRVRAEFWPPGTRGTGWNVLPAPGSPMEYFGEGVRRFLLERYTGEGKTPPMALEIEGKREEFEGEATPRWAR
ncbi:MAG: hypothetical protein EOO75_21040 [Myxococcales bacterium]|nr:MAG: hypothetical protein EOO75_21040 [Myxococcales bacterium]